MNNALTTGTRFNLTGSRRWRDESGNRHTHSYTLLCQVTSVTPAGMTWDRVEILQNDNAPKEGAFVPANGKMAWFGWDAALNRGDVATI